MIRFVSTLTLTLSLATLTARVHAQEAPPPSDPAHAGVRRAMGEGPPVTEARPSADVPAGTVRVRVLRADGSPIERATVRLGVMAQTGDRTAQHRQTGADGIATFAGLAKGQGQAYRPRVVHEGATYATTPFQLEPDRGHECVVRIFPTTRRLESVLLVRGQAIIELRPERMHVTMQLDLANIAEETYVFPEGGLAIRLPPGATAFQAQESMADQRLTAEDGSLRIRGSIPPGRAAMVFGYDLPYDGDTRTLTFPNPFRTIGFGVAVEHAPGLALEVEGFPGTERVEADGRAFLITQRQRGPEDPPLDTIEVAITGIPGKGPYALLATLLSIAVFGVVLVLTRRGGDRSAVAEAQTARKAELVAQAAKLRDEREAGEVGPSHYAKTREALIDELAAILANERRGA